MYYRIDGKHTNKVIFATVFRCIDKSENHNKWTVYFYDDQSDHLNSLISFRPPYFITKYAALYFVDSFARKSGKTVLNITILNNY
jgi:hypothetical protein